MTRPDLCLDFANTRYWRGQATPTETLNAPTDLAAWLKTAKMPAAKEFDLAIRIGPVAGGAYNDALAGKRKLSQP